MSRKLTLFFLLALYAATGTMAQYRTVHDYSDGYFGLYIHQAFPWDFTMYSDTKKSLVTEIEGITYHLDLVNGAAEVYDSFEGKSGEIAIPSNVRYEGKDYPVVQFRGPGRSANESVTKITLPTSLRIIASGAFQNMKAITDLEVPEGVEYIDANAFYNCDALRKLTLPSTLQVMWYAAIGGSTKSIDTLIFKSIVPPYLYSDRYDVLGDRNDTQNPMRKHTTLVVPEKAIATYGNKELWDFGTIKGLNEEQSCIKIVHGEYQMTSDIRPANTVNMDVFSAYENIYNAGNNLSGHITVSGDSPLKLNQFRMNTARSWEKYSPGSGNTKTVMATLIAESPISAEKISTTLELESYWTFMSFPFDVRVGDIKSVTEGVNIMIKKFSGERRAACDYDNVWVTQTADDVLHAYEGFIIKANSIKETIHGFDITPVDNKRKQKIFASDDVEVPLEQHYADLAHNRSWNLIGNPYPAYYDTRWMNTTAPFVRYNYSYNNYQSFSPVDDAMILVPGEAILVQCPLNEESLVFLAEGRQHTATPRELGSADKTRAMMQTRAKFVDQRDILNFTISSDSYSDHTRLVINQLASSVYDADTDAPKFFGDGTRGVELYSISDDDVCYSICERPLGNYTAKLGIRAAQAGTYTLSLNTKSEMPVMLYDKATGQSISLNEKAYTFIAEIGQTDNRFILYLASGTLHISDINAADGQAAVYNTQGMKISDNPDHLPSGVYIIRHGNDTKKISVTR